MNRNRPPALVFLLAQARLTIEAEHLTGIRMPIFAHFELLQILDCARRLRAG